jgi:DNA primase
MSNCIDFKALRAELRFADVLAAYNVPLKMKGRDQHMGFCPLPTHRSKAKRSPSFSANLAKGIWRCFGCSASGNVLDFVTRMEGGDPTRPDDVRRAAVAITARLGIDRPPASDARSADRNPPRPSGRGARDQAAAPEIMDENVIVNAPLDFELKGLDPHHPYLKERGFTPQTIKQFGLGYCSRGLLAGRVAIPLHDGQGNLLGYAGRIVDDGKIDETHPKYLFPPPRERDGKTFVLRKSLFLYNAHRIETPVDDLIVVEGFPSVWWLTQQDFPNVMALMGASCSEEQAAIVATLTAPSARIWLMTDGDDAGIRCAGEVLTRVSPRRFCRWLKLPDGRQPTDCPAKELHNMFGMT